VNKIFRLIAVFVIAILLPAATARAYYEFVSGELRDSKTGAVWSNGATVEIYDCASFTTVATQIVDSSGMFSIPVSSFPTPPVIRALCIEVTFSPGISGTPGMAAKGPYRDRPSISGTLSTGVYFTGTGPNAIALRDMNATTALTPWPLILAAVLVAAVMLALGLMLRKRTAKA
jgi:hypothetical protein